MSCYKFIWVNILRTLSLLSLSSKMCYQIIICCSPESHNAIESLLADDHNSYTVTNQILLLSFNLHKQVLRINLIPHCHMSCSHHPAHVALHSHLHLHGRDNGHHLQQQHEDHGKHLLSYLPCLHSLSRNNLNHHNISLHWCANLGEDELVAALFISGKPTWSSWPATAFILRVVLVAADSS